MVIRLSALSALRSLLSLWDLDPEQCLAPALGWLVPALYAMFKDVREMDNRQEVRFGFKFLCLAHDSFHGSD